MRTPWRNSTPKIISSNVPIRIAARRWGWNTAYGTPNNGWLKRLLTRKPRMIAAIAPANKMARGLWAMMTKQEDYRNPVATMA